MLTLFHLNSNLSNHEYHTKMLKNKFKSIFEHGYKLYFENPKNRVQSLEFVFVFAARQLALTVWDPAQLNQLQDPAHQPDRMWDPECNCSISSHVMMIEQLKHQISPFICVVQETTAYMVKPLQSNQILSQNANKIMHQRLQMKCYTAVYLWPTMLNIQCHIAIKIMCIAAHLQELFACQYCRKDP